MPSSQTTLSTSDKARIKSAIPSSSLKVLVATLARIYYSYPESTEWSYAGVEGGLAFTMDKASGQFWFKVVDLSGKRGVIWEQRLVEPFEYHQDRPIFHSFAGELCMIGVVFADESEANALLKKVRGRSKYSSKRSHTPQPIDPSKISAPQIDSFKHIGHIGYDPERGFATTKRPLTTGAGGGEEEEDPSWRYLIKELEELGVAPDVIEENQQFIEEFVRDAATAVPVPIIEHTPPSSAHNHSSQSHSSHNHHSVSPPNLAPVSASAPAATTLASITTTLAPTTTTMNGKTARRAPSREAPPPPAKTPTPTPTPTRPVPDPPPPASASASVSTTLAPASLSAAAARATTPAGRATTPLEGRAPGSRGGGGPQQRFPVIETQTPASSLGHASLRGSEESDPGGRGGGARDARGDVRENGTGARGGSAESDETLSDMPLAPPPRSHSHAHNSYAYGQQQQQRSLSHQHSYSSHGHAPSSHAHHHERGHSAHGHHGPRKHSNSNMGIMHARSASVPLTSAPSVGEYDKAYEKGKMLPGEPDLDEDDMVEYDEALEEEEEEEIVPAEIVAAAVAVAAKSKSASPVPAPPAKQPSASTTAPTLASAPNPPTNTHANGTAHANAPANANTNAANTNATANVNGNGNGNGGADPWLSLLTRVDAIGINPDVITTAQHALVAARRDAQRLLTAPPPPLPLNHALSAASASGHSGTGAAAQAIHGTAGQGQGQGQGGEDPRLVLLDRLSELSTALESVAATQQFLQGFVHGAYLRSSQ